MADVERIFVAAQQSEFQKYSAQVEVWFSIWQANSGTKV
jgi:hypothetical protein